MGACASKEESPKLKPEQQLQQTEQTSTDEKKENDTQPEGEKTEKDEKTDEKAVDTAKEGDEKTSDDAEKKPAADETNEKQNDEKVEKATTEEKKTDDEVAATAEEKAVETTEEKPTEEKVDADVAPAQEEKQAEVEDKPTEEKKAEVEEEKPAEEKHNDEKVETATEEKPVEEKVEAPAEEKQQQPQEEQKVQEEQPTIEDDLEEEIDVGAAVISMKVEPIATETSTPAVEEEEKKPQQEEPKQEQKTNIVEKTLEEAFVAENARTIRNWDQTKTVTADEVLKLYDVVKNGPTAFNISPLRFAILDTKEKKQLFVETLMEGNKEPMLTAPLTIVMAYDPEFDTKLDYLSPGYAGAKEYYDSVDMDTRITAAKLNAQLQVGYWITALRVAGYSLGPASGFNPEAANEILFSKSEKSKNWRSFMYINVGYIAEDAKLYPRFPRFEADQICADL